MIDRIYQFIISYKQKNDGVSPTIREIMDGLRITSTSDAVAWLAELEAQGRIKRMGKGRSRGIIIPGGRWVAPGCVTRVIAEPVEDEGRAMARFAYYGLDT